MAKCGRLSFVFLVTKMFILRAMMTVLYRDLPKYNDRRRNLWLPDVIHQQLLNQHGAVGLHRTASNPSLYCRSRESCNYTTHIQDSPAWHWDSPLIHRRQMDSVSVLDSTASFASRLTILRYLYCSWLLLHFYCDTRIDSSL